MSATSSRTEQHEPIFRGFDSSVERLLGADMRLLYGLGAPILMVVGLIIVLALQPAAWLVGMIVVVEIAGLATVITGLLGMMSTDDDEDEII
jgi:hypothetical protein